MSVRSLSEAIAIRSAQGDYSVEFVESPSGLLAKLQIDDDTFALFDESVAVLYPQIRGAFREHRYIEIAAVEGLKTLQGVERVCLELQRLGASKRSRLVVVGGGIVQDVGTFCSHIYFRGIPYEYVPTTVLSMADSCIGAKCALNLGPFKNQIGFFQSPRRVHIWPGFAETLPANDVRSGYGEILKLAITHSEEIFSALATRLSESGFSLEALPLLIGQALSTKKMVIEIDEYDRALRKTLNYGHTFGHALEAITHNEVPHGLAVAWGLDVANFVAWRSGLWSEREYRRVHAVVKSHFAMTVAARYEAGMLVEAMGRDKKTSGDSILLVLPKGFGNLQLVSRRRDQELIDLIAEYMSKEDVFSV